MLCSVVGVESTIPKEGWSRTYSMCHRAPVQHGQEMLALPPSEPPLSMGAGGGCRCLPHW